MPYTYMFKENVYINYTKKGKLRQVQIAVQNFQWDQKVLLEALNNQYQTMCGQKFQLVKFVFPIRDRMIDRM